MIPGNEEPIVAVLTDPEVSNTQLEVLWKSDARPEEFNSTAQGMLLDLVIDIVSQVMSERFDEIVSKPGAPFFAAQLEVGNLCETCEAVIGGVAVKDGEAVSGLRAFLTEVEKMKRFGFTEDEVNRAKTEIESVYETRSKRADTRQNSEFVPGLISNFFDNYAYMDYLEPPITRVGQPVEDMAMLATKILFDRIDGISSGSSQLKLSPTLSPGASVARRQ